MPPGTGEIADTIFDTWSKSTSPISLRPAGSVSGLFKRSDLSGTSRSDLEDGRTLIPTSITTWFGDTKSLVINFGRPAATIKMSADLVILSKF